MKIGNGAVTDVTDVGLDRHLNQESAIIENTNSERMNRGEL
jgi:hypothetical protein